MSNFLKQIGLMLLVLILVGCHRCERMPIDETQLSLYRDMAATDPEAFGQRIMDSEFAMVEIKRQIASFDEAGDKDKLVELKNAYRDKQQEVQTMLAVVGMNSPG